MIHVTYLEHQFIIIEYRNNFIIYFTVLLLILGKVCRVKFFI